MRAQEDGHARVPDLILLERATELGRVVFSMDRDFVNEARKKQQHSLEFSGVIYCDMNHLTLGACIENLWVIADLCEPDELYNKIQFIPI